MFNIIMAIHNWFILKNETVSGPFAKEQILEKISSDSNSDILIWGRGQQEWLNPMRWQNYVKEVELGVKSTKQTERLWKLKKAHSEYPPMSFSQMIQFLKELDDINGIKIWVDNSKDWKDIYQVQRVIDELGISRRSHPRVPIMGNAQIDNSKNVIESKVVSISEGGLGLSNSGNFSIGENIKCVIKSPNLFSTIHATGEIVYKADNGYTGVRFINLPTEARSTIVEYVKKFNIVNKKERQSLG